MKTTIYPVLALLSLPSALAESTVSTVGQKIYDILSPLSAVSLGTEYGDFYLRALIFILVFAILFYVLQFVFKEEKGKRIRIVVALVISIIAIIGIPAKVISAIVLSYTITVVFFLIVLPIFAIVMLNTKVFHEPTRANYVVKTLLFALLAMLIANIMHIQMPEHIDTIELEGWLGFAQAVVVILAVWSGFMALFTSSATAQVGEEGKHPASKFWDWLKKPAEKRPEKKRPEPREISDIRRVTVDSKERIREIQAHIRKLISFFKKGNVSEADKREVDEMLREIRYDERDFEKFIEKGNSLISNILHFGNLNVNGAIGNYNNLQGIAHKKTPPLPGSPQEMAILDEIGDFKGRVSPVEQKIVRIVGLLRSDGVYLRHHLTYVHDMFRVNKTKELLVGLERAHKTLGDLLYHLDDMDKEEVYINRHFSNLMNVVARYAPGVP